MTHPIPSSFRLRRRKWDITRKPVANDITAAGHCFPVSKKIHVYDEARNRKRTAPEQQRTFWHEVTHAILFTMNHKLARNEPFVIQFSLLLEELIRTARFEGEKE